MSLPNAPRPQPWRASAQAPLLDLLGAVWRMDAAVVSVAWNGDLACFALGDGSLAMGRAEWDGAPTVAPREQGGMELTRGTSPPPPVTRLRVHDGGCRALAADPRGGFLSGGEDGTLARTTDDGCSTVLASHPGAWVEHVAAGRAGWHAGTIGRRVILSGPGTSSLDLPAAATALAFDAAGARLAVAYHRGVTLWSADGTGTRTLATPGTPRAIAWSPDGHYVVCGLQENALHGWRLSDGVEFEMGGYAGQPRCLSFAAGGAFLATSGGARVVCWDFDPPDAGEPARDCGLPSSRTPVSRVACHPEHSLVAAGYHNGAVMLCQPGSDDVLFVRASSAGAAGGEPGTAPPGSSVVALAWSADGTRLATGTEGGEVALLALPAQLFRFATTTTPRRASA